MDRNIDQIEFSLFDTETTGLEPESGDRIVEIAGIRFKGKEKIATFESLVNPHRRICEAAERINKITPVMLRGAPTIEAVLPKFLAFMQNSCLCSYNATFDVGFLNNELKIIGQNSLENTMIVDILRMAKRILPN